MKGLVCFAVAACLAAPATLLKAEESKPAGRVFKNVTQLKDTPADQLFPAMQFISTSLGVECGFCHVQGKMELDDKPEKKTAREMMAMTAAINAGGVKIPYRWTLARPNGRFTIQIADVKSNAAVADARFAKPAGEVGK